MAIYHLQIKAISRSAGRSATAADAYRTGERIEDARTGEVHDYRRRAGVVHTELFLPPAAPAWAADRQQIWNAAEAAEKRKNSVVAREFEVALPAELSASQRLALVREFGAALVERHGLAADVAIHAPGRQGDQRNHHAHVLCSTRRLEAEGFTKKTRELDDPKSGEVAGWRERWSEITNRHLERAGAYVRVDHRSLEAQGIDRPPGVHLGPKFTAIERKGHQTIRGNKNRERQAQVVELAKVRRQIDAERKRTSTPEQIKAIWHSETAQQFGEVSAKAAKIRVRAKVAQGRHQKRVEENRQQRPAPPSGLFARLKMAAYEQTYKAWASLRDGLQRRADQLSDRVTKLGEYMRRSGAYEAKTPGERLAEKKAAQAHPELAAAYRQVTEKESREKARQQKEKQAERQKQRQRHDAMTPEQRKEAVLRQLKEKIAKERQGKGRSR